MWKALLCAGLLALLPIAGQAAEETVAENEGLPEKAAREEMQLAPKRKPLLELHGDYRWLYGEGRFRADVQSTAPVDAARLLTRGEKTFSRHDQKVWMETRRLRLFPTLHITDHLAVKAMLEDDRTDKGEEEGITKNHHLYLSRAYLEYDNHFFKAEAGRFNYFLIDGNLMDKRVEGVRLRYKDSASPTGRFTLAYVRTVDGKSAQREGWILENKREEGKWLTHAAYIDFHSSRRRRESIPLLSQYGFDVGRTGERAWDHQRIGECTISYSPNDDWTVGADLVWAYGHHKSDGYHTNETSYVAHVLYGEADPRKPGSHGVWLRYYHVPSAALIAPTMDADTTFFRRMGFRGWGARMDYVVAKGLVWAVEGFSLQNRSDGPFTKNFHEYVLGTSLTAYF